MASGHNSSWRGEFILVMTISSFACGVAWTARAQGDFQGSTHMMPFDEDTLRYGKTEDSSEVARLQERINKGERKLEHDATHGYLLSLLKELNVLPASQTLVFSKTSFQRERISPQTPRAVYFGDNVYVGYVQGSSLLEISAVDPKLGGVFYTLEQTKTGKPKFVRTDQCLECHASAKTMGVPGHLIRSFATDENGVVDLASGTSLVNHRTPFAERWGGWYVTGTHGDLTHRGNVFGKAALARKEADPKHLGNIETLDRFFDASRYPSGSSDIVALMVMEHQVHMHNFITRLNYEATMALQQYGHIRYLRSILDALVKYLLFAEEAPLGATVKGSTEFSRQFAALGPRDKQGRSLRDFDLKQRLFKYPCSFVIYSEAFERIPEQARNEIYRRMFDILTERDSRPGYEHLSPEDRQALREILAETKPGLPEYWRERQTADRSR
jgi:hypothetical protein